MIGLSLLHQEKSSPARSARSSTDLVMGKGSCDRAGGLVKPLRTLLTRRPGEQDPVLLGAIAVALWTAVTPLNDGRLGATRNVA